MLCLKVGLVRTVVPFFRRFFLRELPLVFFVSLLTCSLVGLMFVVIVCHLQEGVERRATEACAVQ